MALKGKRLLGVSYTLSVLFSGMFAHALPASSPASTSSSQEQAGNMTSSPAATSSAQEQAGNMTSSPAATSSAQEQAGNVTSSPAATSSAQEQAGNMTSSPAATSSAQEQAGNMTSSPAATSSAQEQAGHMTSSPAATSSAQEQAGNMTSSPAATSSAQEQAGHMTSSPAATSSAQEQAGNMTSSPAATSSAQEQAGNVTEEMPRAQSQRMTRSTLVFNSTRTSTLTHTRQADNRHVANLLSHDKTSIDGGSQNSQDTTQTSETTKQDTTQTSETTKQDTTQTSETTKQDTTQTSETTKHELSERSHTANLLMKVDWPQSQQVTIAKNTEVNISHYVHESQETTTQQTVQLKTQGFSSDNLGVKTSRTNRKDARRHPRDSEEAASLQIVDVTTKRHAHYGSDFSTSKAPQAHITGHLFTSQNVSTTRKHSQNSLVATEHANEFQTRKQPAATIARLTADEMQTIESLDTSPVSLDWIPHCEVVKGTPTPAIQEPDCPPTTQLWEQLSGTVEWGYDVINCSQQLFVLHFRVPEDYGFVLEFRHVEVKQRDALTIYQVSNSDSPRSSRMSCSPAQTFTEKWLHKTSLSPLMLHTNNMQLVLRSANSWEGLKINASYEAHPHTSIPYSSQVNHDQPTESRYVYHCDGLTNLPAAISCDGIRHCEHGQDEENCTYRDEGCGDWYPHKDVCIKAIFMRLSGETGTPPTVPLIAEETCRNHNATLVAFVDPGSQEAVADMIRKSGFSNAVVGLKRAQLVSSDLTHLYRFVWQWGLMAGPIAYEQQQLQRETGPEECAQLNIHPSPRLRPVHCAFAAFPPDGYICMSPNPRRLSAWEPTPLLGLALPVASSVSVPFKTKTCPDGSLVQIFHTCRWRRLWEEQTDSEYLADGLSPNNFAVFQCRDSWFIHYSVLCDGRPDCRYVDDETCDLLQSSPLLNSSIFNTLVCPEVPLEKKCDGRYDCLNDDFDEQFCDSCNGTILCSGYCLPNHYSSFFQRCPGKKDDALTPKTYNPAKVVLDGYGLSRLEPVSGHCDEGFYQCQGGLCIPTYMLNNGELDCVTGEDEGIPWNNFTCPGYYKCFETGTCVHSMYLCDGIYHCPYKDDELYCRLACPHDRGCVCEGNAYKCSKMINPLDNLHVRYLDLSFAANVSLDNLYYMEYLAFLNLSFCRLVSVTLIDMYHLQTLDLSSNLLTQLSSLRLVTLRRVIYLDLSNNPFLKTLSAEFTGMLQTGELHSLRTLTLMNVGLEVIDKMSLSRLPKLKRLDIRANQLRRYSTESLHGLVSLEDLYTDETKLCCPYFHPSVSRCHAPVDELSSCSDLLGTAIYRVCLWALAVLALVGNCGVLFYRFLLLVRTRTPLSAASILVKSLCVSDLLMGVYLAMIGAADAQLSGTYVSREREWRSSVMCTVAGVLSLVSSEVSALVISLITLDRVLVLCFPFKPQLHLTPRATVLSCLGVWVAGVVLAVVPLLTGMEFYGQTGICIPLPITRQQFSGQYFAFGVFIIFNFVIFLSIGAGQLMIYRAVRKASAAAGSSRQSRDFAVARRLFLIVLTDFCCWFPVGVMGLLAALGTPIPGEVNVWAAIFVLPLNSALNPFLYTLSALMQRVRLQRAERKVKKIVGTLHNEIQKWDAATVQDVTRICVRSGLVQKDAVDRMFAARVPPLTNQDCAAQTEVARDSAEVSNPCGCDGSACCTRHSHP